VQSQQENAWHTVAMARKGSKVWVHHPAYNPATGAKDIKRVDGISGTATVQHLFQQWPNVAGMSVQGPLSSYMAITGKMECKGRRAQ
jgi:hypothetical protein